MSSFLSPKPLHLKKSQEAAGPVPKGQAHAVALPNSKKPGRSAVYRNWRFQDALVDTLDPEVRTVHESECPWMKSRTTRILTSDSIRTDREEIAASAISRPSTMELQQASLGPVPIP
jgi:hypothetical protein